MSCTFRRIVHASFLVALACGCTPLSPSAATANPTEAAQTVETKGDASTTGAYVVLLRLRYDLFAKWKATGKWPDDPEANRALDGHVAFWKGQRESGKALLAGGMKGDYWDNVALIIFEASSLSEAEALVAADPAVKAYVFQAQVRPFDVSFIGTKDSQPAK